MVEQVICNHQVAGSSPVASSKKPLCGNGLCVKILPDLKAAGSELAFPSLGGVPEWLKGAGCKPAGFGLRWFKSIRHHSGDG